MNLEEAIRVTKVFITYAETEKELELAEALKLGIEALCFVTRLQALTLPNNTFRLPSETED